VLTEDEIEIIAVVHGARKPGGGHGGSGGQRAHKKSKAFGSGDIRRCPEITEANHGADGPSERESRKQSESFVTICRRERFRTLAGSIS
jgi:hypothetical protein